MHKCHLLRRGGRDNLIIICANNSWVGKRGPRRHRGGEKAVREGCFVRGGGGGRPGGLAFGVLTFLIITVSWELKFGVILNLMTNYVKRTHTTYRP